MKILTHSVLILAIAVGYWSAWPPPVRAATMTIPAGFDLFETIAGSPSGTDGTWLIVSFPQGFFGTMNGAPSDPYSGLIPYEGDPTGPDGYTFPVGFKPVNDVAEAVATAHHLVRDPRDGGGGLGDTDTIVQRSQDVNLPNNGDSGTTGLQIQSLSLKTVAPVDVTFGGMLYNSLFDGTLNLDPSVTQPMGSMTLTRTGDTGGTFDSTLPVIPYLSFVPESQVVQGSPGPFDGPVQVFTSTDTPFTTVPEPSTLALFRIGAIWFVGYVWRSRRKAKI